MKSYHPPAERFWAFSARILRPSWPVLAICVGVGLWLWFRGADASASALIVPTSEPTISVTMVLPAWMGQGPVAHYTEHLSWLPNIGKGSRPEDLHSNAWTNAYSVAYWLSGQPDDLTDILRRLKVVFDPITLPPKTAETERDILLREYELRLALNPDGQAAMEVDAFLYQGNAIANSASGTPDQIRALTYDAAKTFHDATHRPERARLVVSGDVSARHVANALKAAGFPDLEANRDQFDPPPFDLASPETRTFRYPDPNAAPRMTWRKVVTLPEPVDFDLLEAQTALARDILDTDLPGGLAGPLRFDAFVTKSFGISITPIDETHIELIFSAEPDKGVGFAAMQSAFEAALAASAQGVPRATYDRVRARFDGFWPDWSDEDETGRWMANYTLSRAMVLREAKTQRQMRKIDAQIDASDVASILTALAGPGRTAIAFIGTDPSP